jgi:hypothetical protein
MTQGEGGRYVEMRARDEFRRVVAGLLNGSPCAFRAQSITQLRCLSPVKQGQFRRGGLRKVPANVTQKLKKIGK